MLFKSKYFISALSINQTSLSVLNREFFLLRWPIPAKVSFVEVPTDTAVPVGTEETLKCVTSSRVEKCVWIWKPLHGNDPEIVLNEFPSNGDLGRNCSLHLPHVYAEKQGYWSCQVSITSLNTVLTSPSAKLMIYEQGKICFVNFLHSSIFLYFSIFLNFSIFFTFLYFI